MRALLRTIALVFTKEFRENLRDRRTVFAALLVGPLLGPLMLGFMLQFMVERGGRQLDEPVTLPVVHAERAPNLMGFLAGRGVHVEPVPTISAQAEDADARTRVLQRRARMVLVIPADYGTRLLAGEPAPLLLYADTSNSNNERFVRRVRAVLGEYARSIAALRLSLRGVDGITLAPVTVQDIDVSTPASRSVLALGVLTFLMLTAMLTGGMYLAIDSTAGERERGTLEPLLTTAVDRSALIYGKILATCAYMLISLALTVTAFALRLRFVGLESLGMSANLDAPTVLKVIAVTLPLIPVGAALMTIMASFTRSYREAQAWLSFVLLVPTLPLVFASMLDLAASPPLMAVPSLGQHFLITSLLRAEPLAPLPLLISVGSSLALGTLMVLFAGRLYQRERLLG